MRRLALVAAVIATTLVAACGGSTKTVSVTGSTPSSTSPATPSTTNGGGATGKKASAVAACLRAAGAAVVGPNPAGRGTAVRAITRDSGDIGYLEGPTPRIAFQIAQVFLARGGWKLEPLKNNPQAFGIYKGTLTSADSALLSKCTG